MHESIDQLEPDENTPILPIDLLLARANQWLEQQEKLKSEAKKRPEIPDDIPRFVTEYHR